jgi:hypothetical protein
MTAASTFRAPDQQALAPDLGVAEPGAGLRVPVDPFLHRVDIDERQHVRAGQQRRGLRQPGQEHPAGLLQLPGAAPGERAQERPQCRRRPDPVEQVRHGAVAQHVHVIDAVRSRGHPRDQAARLQVRIHPGRARDLDMPTDQARQAAPFG